MISNSDFTLGNGRLQSEDQRNTLREVLKRLENPPDESWYNPPIQHKAYNAPDEGGYSIGGRETRSPEEVEKSNRDLQAKWDAINRIDTAAKTKRKQADRDARTTWWSDPELGQGPGPVPSHVREKWARTEERELEWNRRRNAINAREEDLRLTAAEADLSRQEEFNEKRGPAATKPYTGPTHFTNIPGTVEKWKGEGVKPQGIKFVNDGATPIPEKPEESKLKDFDEFNKAFAPIVSKAGLSPDIMKVNPVEAGIKAGQGVATTWSSVLSNPHDPQFNDVMKLVKQAETRAEKSAEYSQTNYKNLHTSFLHFWDKEGGRQEAEKARTANREAAEAVRNAAKIPTMIQAQRMTDSFLDDPTNRYLTQEETADLEGLSPRDISLKLRYKQMFPEKLAALNQQRQAAGLGPLKQVFTPSKQGGPGFYEYKEQAPTGGRIGSTISKPALSREEALAELRRRGRI